MFARLSTALLALTLVTSAIAGSHHKSRVEAEQCNGGEIQCCYGVQDSKSLDNEVTKLLGHLKIDAKQITGQVGVGCTALNALGAGGGSSCTEQKVCCTNNSFNGVVALGCSPANVSA